MTISNSTSTIFSSSCKTQSECNFDVKVSNDEDGNFIKTLCCKENLCNVFSSAYPKFLFNFNFFKLFLVLIFGLI